MVSISAVPCVPFKKPGNTTSDNDHKTFFGDIVSYRALEGYMFPDGSVWKFVACRQNYVNDLMGQWNETSFKDCKGECYTKNSC